MEACTLEQCLQCFAMAVLLDGKCVSCSTNDIMMSSRECAQTVENIPVCQPYTPAPTVVSPVHHNVVSFFPPTAAIEHTSNVPDSHAQAAQPLLQPIHHQPVLDYVNHSELTPFSLNELSLALENPHLAPPTISPTELSFLAHPALGSLPYLAERQNESQPSPYSISGSVQVHRGVEWCYICQGTVDTCTCLYYF